MSRPKLRPDLRGYDRPHRMRRKVLEPWVASGHAPCCLCFQPIRPGEPWALDHTRDRTGYRGIAHRACNSRDGALRRNQGPSKDWLA